MVDKHLSEEIIIKLNESGKQTYSVYASESSNKDESQEQELLKKIDENGFLKISFEEFIRIFGPMGSHTQLERPEILIGDRQFDIRDEVTIKLTDAGIQDYKSYINYLIRKNGLESDGVYSKYMEKLHGKNLVISFNKLADVFGLKMMGQPFLDGVLYINEESLQEPLGYNKDYLETMINHR